MEKYSKEELFSDKYKTTDFVWGQSLGEGAFGNVKFAILKKDKTKKFALKAMKKNDIIQSKHVDHIENEKKILEMINHPFIMRYYGFLQDDRYIYFVTELLKGGDLFTYHRTVGNFNPKTTAFYGAQVVSIFEYLQSKDIVYRDLKPENIMIGADGYLQLIDFGFAKVITKRTYTICGTPEYIAPEILLNQGHGKPVDWWTLGILLYEMLAGYPPFQDDDPMNIYRKIINTKPKYPDGFDSKCKSLVKHLLRRDLSKRYGNLKNGADDIKEHRFFEEINFADLLDRKLKTPYTPDSKELKLTECNWEKEKALGVKATPTADDPFLDW